MPVELRRRLRMLAAKMDQSLQETAAAVVEAGLRVVEDGLKKKG